MLEENSNQSTEARALAIAKARGTTARRGAEAETQANH